VGSRQEIKGEIKLGRHQSRWRSYLTFQYEGGTHFNLKKRRKVGGAALSTNKCGDHSNKGYWDALFNQVQTINALGNNQTCNSCINKREFSPLTQAT